MSSAGDQAPRQLPRFIPTLTNMVPAAAAEPASLPAESHAVVPALIPAAFAELLKDWPTLGDPAVPGAPSAQPPVPAAEHPSRPEARADGVAQRAEALVLQRLPALMAGLVSQAVRDAMAELTAGDHTRQE